jgi:hypothetical protein
MQRKVLNKKGLLALALVLTMVIGSVAMITATSNNAYATTTPGSNTVIFDETGLATGTNWTVEFGSGTTLKEYSSTTTSLNVPVTANGTYSFSVVNPNGYSGSPSSGTVSITKYNVAGATNITESITFTPTAKTYEVTFVTGNLTAGQVWSVTVNGVAASSNTNTVAFYLANGTYSFSIPNVGHWYATPFKGTFTVAGTSNLAKWMNGVLQNNITFSYGYVVSFKAASLPLYVPWSVTFNGVTNSTTGSSAYVNFSIKNGSSYSYSINIAPDWTASPASGTVTVSGAAVAQTITFTEVFYKIIFVETGLPSGTAWIININGVPYPTTNGTVIITEHNGSYSYSAESMPGYTASPASGTVALGYNDVTVHIVYSTSTVKSGSGNGTGGGFSLPSLNAFITFFHSETGIVTIALVAIVLIGLVVGIEMRGNGNKHRRKMK